jgi:hypothetical protein
MRELTPVADTVMPVAVAPTAPVHAYMVQYWDTTIDCRDVHVIDPPVADGVPIVAGESSPEPTNVSRSPATTSNAGVVLVAAVEP